MKTLLLLSLLTSCASLREGERIGPFEGMAWSVDCARDTPHSLHERYEYENPYYLCDPMADYEGCSYIYVHRYRYEWAKAEYRKKCENAA